MHFPDSISVSGSKDKTGDEKSDEDYLKEPPAKKMKRGGLQTTLKGMDSAGPGGSDSGPKESKWREVDSLLVFQYGPAVHSTKVASFDVDNTIIETSSGKKFATGPTDWKFMSQVTGKLKSLAKEGFKIIFITNQLGISKGKPTKQEFKKKTEDIASKLDVPLLVLASTTKDIYRKPCTGMWEHLLQHENGSVEIDMKSSFYVGDAAGREVGWLPGNHFYRCVVVFMIVGLLEQKKIEIPYLKTKIRTPEVLRSIIFSHVCQYGIGAATVGGQCLVQKFFL